MHEYPLSLQIIQKAEEKAKEWGMSRVTRIDLVIGESSGIAFECIELYFDIVSEGSMCEGATLCIERIKPMLRCKVCGKLFERKPFSFSCTDENCPGEGETTDIGREFLIRSVTAT